MKLSVAESTSSYEIFLKTIKHTAKESFKPNQLLSFYFSLPEPFFQKDFSHLFVGFQNAFYFSARHEEFFAAGNIFSIKAEGALRWQSIEKQFNEFPAPLVNLEESQCLNTPLFLACVKFNDHRSSKEWLDFPNTELYIPKLLIVKHGSSTLFRFNRLLNSSFSSETALQDFSETLSSIMKVKEIQKGIEDAHNLPFEASNSDHSAWKLKIEKALAEIKSNRITKVVLARRILHKQKQPVHFELLPARLKKTNPSSHLFFIKKNDSVFLGASPEILIEQKNDLLITEAIAGSQRRGINRTEDLQLENELRSSEKEMNEHRSVVDFITHNLDEVVSTIKFDESPKVKKLASIQHLSTEITATLKPGASLFSVIDKIFPTPAVCGNPKDKAFALISELEDFDRGLYAGLIGWVSPASAKMVVAIRSALINKNTIFAYAGCGIVEGSNHESEFKETEVKLKTILSTLNEKN